MDVRVLELISPAALDIHNVRGLRDLSGKGSLSLIEDVLRSDLDLRVG
jgi:hypothetical protein